MSKQHQSELQYQKSTKGSHVYSNDFFAGVYIPKHLIASLSPDGSIPQTLIITISAKETN